VTEIVVEDKARPVRNGEELDVQKLGEFLDKELGIGATGALAVEQFPGGHSNLTYLVRHGDQEYVLRRPPFGSKVKSAHDMGREVAVLSKLAPVYDRAPKVIAYEPTGEVLGAPFYLMERRRGSRGSAICSSTHSSIYMPSITPRPDSAISASRSATSSVRSRAGPSATSTPRPTTSPP